MAKKTKAAFLQISPALQSWISPSTERLGCATIL